MAAHKFHTHELRAALDRVLAAVEKNHGSQITLDEDYYWHLPVEDAYDLSTEPEITTVGQVSDDLAEIKQLLSSDEPVLAIWHELSHLIGVLRVMEKMSLP